MSIKIGVIGAGFIGPVHIEAVRRLGDVEVIAISASSQAHADAKAHALGVSRAYGDWRALVADKDVEVVHNTAPNYLHAEINRAVIAARKHLLCEKPLGVTPDETRAMLRGARAAKIVHGVCFNYRMYPMTQEMRVRIGAGALGNVRIVHGHYLQDWLMFETDYNWRVDPARGGASQALGDIGSHWCDLAQFVSGLRITALCADTNAFITSRQRPKGEIETFAASAAGETEFMRVSGEDYATVLLQFENGARGSFLISQLSGGHKNDLALEVNGTLASLGWQQEQPERLWVGQRDAANAVLLKQPNLLTERARKFAHYPGGHIEGYPDGFKNLVARFYAYIRDGRDRQKDAADFPTFEDGHRAALVVDAILRSAKERAWVAVPTA
ncbi:MAG: Gfo/Idh/MocA family oxidoreductase [Chloroflexi bacterium]|nr:MAG: Gfo/Idh/MocA family oxidoreductase [Chloroflexota bacterium]